ncbi:unnamed protein product [Dracunculus medinensis]|uniref:ATP synthase subunit s-like protein n=1 Tax=Dracunculus medinensis TaxID=318479 RepID=A0A0N4UF59_DRAME|nr:unnamed protein product [Dracunculus medinensis]
MRKRFVKAFVMHLFIYLNCCICKENSEVSAKLKGRICAYGDMDRDLYTDLIVKSKHFLKIYLQGENGEFTESSQAINLASSHAISCAVGDFNGDSVPDILISRKKTSLIPFFSGGNNGYEAIVYINNGNGYSAHIFNETFLDEVPVMDINGDGISDIIGFLLDGSLFCRLGGVPSDFIPCERNFRNFDIKPFPNFLHSFVDITGDLSAEIVFGTVIGGGLKLSVWRRVSNILWEHDSSFIPDLPISSCKNKFYGAALYADFDADGLIDIGIPCCSDENCAKVEVILMWNQRFKQWQDYRISGLEGSKLVSKKEEGNVVFRIGDFSLDGYPDLIALIRETSQNPMIFENVPCNDCISNATRKFELRTSPRLIQPADVSLGEIQMVSFFDLKEDGTLDVLLEYRDVDRTDMTIDFIRCEDKGDTTFLKVQVFSSVCQNNCGSTKTRIGSGIAWHGACTMFSMSGSWGTEQRGIQCQMPQTTHRALSTPFALFGLGRSPNFIDYVHIGSPRFLRLPGHSGNQHYDLKQIVPNSRLIVVPPKDNNSHWQSRLYLTPSQLIIQSLAVLVSVCILLLFLVALLHFRERRADAHERQAQSHRFHFDAIRFLRWQELEKEQKEYLEEESIIKGQMYMETGLFLSPEKREDVLPKKDKEDQTRKDSQIVPIEAQAFFTQMRYLDHSFDNLRRYKRYKKFQLLQYDQRFIPERQLFLGPDLAAAHFLVHRGAAIKFIGDNIWIKRNKFGQYDLPGRKVPGLYLEAIDASDTELMFEGFENLNDLRHVRLIRLAGCKYADDWMMSRLGTMFSNSLELLDLSDCDRISAKGLAGLRSLKKLRYLRLEGMDHIKDIAKVVLILEKSISGLKVIGLDYDKALKTLQNEFKLLENDRVVIDAKGNVHIEDDNGRLFYVAGRVNERAVVCDEDKPIMTSTIRREVPEMSDAEFNRLDALSGGKLRHLLVGSPSGYSWTEQVEIILSHEDWWNRKQGIPTDPKLLPKSSRPLLVDENDSQKIISKCDPPKLGANDPV